MSRAIEQMNDAAQRTREERQREFLPFWDRVVDVDVRLAALRDDPDTRTEVEGRLRAWREEERQSFRPKLSEAEVRDMASRLRGVQSELSDLMEEVGRLGASSETGRISDLSSGSALFSILEALDALAPALAMADEIEALPTKAGGRGAYTEKLREKPVNVFGVAMVRLFRKAGIPCGGNGSKDRAFEEFLNFAHHEVAGGNIPGKAALLAELRRR